MKILTDIKNLAILVLIAFMIIVGIMVGRAVKKYLVEIEVLKYDKSRLEMQIVDRENHIKLLQEKEKIHEAKIDSCMIVFKDKDKIIAAYDKKLNDALSQLNGITADSSYQFLQRVAYNYPGVLKFLFNELQVRGIHADWLRARNAEREIPELKLQVDNARSQFASRDSLANTLKGIVALQQANLDDCKKINQDNDQIIKGQDRTIKKERHRKNFWRVVSFTEPPLIGLLILLL